MKKSNIFKLLLIVLITVMLTGCSCGCNCKTYYRSSSECENALNNIISFTDEDSEGRKNQTYNYVSSYINAKRTEFINIYVNGEVTDSFNVDSLSTESIENISTKAASLLQNELNGILVNKSIKTDVEISAETYINNVVSEVSKLTILNTLSGTASNLITSMADNDKYEDYQTVLYNQHESEALASLSEVSVEIKSDDYAESSYDAVLLERAKQIKEIVLTCQTNVQSDSTAPEPIRFQLKSVGDFFVNFFDNFLIYPVGWLLHIFTSLCGNYYIFGLIITTLLIRTIAWPIYAKSNDMTLKMKLMEPEQAKLQEKYARRKDPESQRMMQMELMQLYKKYGVGIGGCIMPLLQLPIFLAVFRAVTRLPYTNGTVGSPDWVTGINSTIFGVDLFADKSGSTAQFIGIIILCVLVGATQILQQVLMNARNKKTQEESQANIPAYRRQAVAQSQNNNTMKIFMWVMVVMMVVFVFTSKAGLGVYWLIGNIYALLQSYIGSKNSEKRLEKLRQKSNRY